MQSLHSQSAMKIRTRDEENSLFQLVYVIIHSTSQSNAASSCLWTCSASPACAPSSQERDGKRILCEFHVRKLMVLSYCSFLSPLIKKTKFEVCRWLMFIFREATKKDHLAAPYELADCEHPEIMKTSREYPRRSLIQRSSLALEEAWTAL